MKHKWPLYPWQEPEVRGYLWTVGPKPKHMGLSAGHREAEGVDTQWTLGELFFHAAHWHFRREGTQAQAQVTYIELALGFFIATRIKPQHASLEYCTPHDA